MVNPTQIPSLLTCRLVAQTPMIHFQPGQAGACLRATEVKPKLDRFLHQQAEKEGMTIPSEWYVKKNARALNYKMHLRRQGPNKRGKLDIRGFKFYFGNLGDAIKKDLVFFDLRLDLICADEELRNFIEKHLKEFFVLHNFGARQSKGFGGFLQDGTTEQEIQTFLARANTVNFGFMCEGNSMPVRFDKANTVYSILRSGLHRGEKIEGFSFAFEPKNERDFIRSRVWDSASGGSEEFVFIRAILGLADQYGIGSRKAYALNYAGAEVRDGKCIVPEADIRGDAGIRRFRSPITIKFFRDRVVFMFDDSYDDVITGKPFIFLDSFARSKFNLFVRSKQYGEAAELLSQAPFIRTPQAFDRKDFVEKFITYFAENKHKNEKADGIDRLILWEGGEQS